MSTAPKSLAARGGAALLAATALVTSSARRPQFVPVRVSLPADQVDALIEKLHATLFAGTEITTDGASVSFAYDSRFHDANTVYVRVHELLGDLRVHGTVRIIDRGAPFLSRRTAVAA